MPLLGTNKPLLKTKQLNSATSKAYVDLLPLEHKVFSYSYTESAIFEEAKKQPFLMSDLRPMPLWVIFKSLLWTKSDFWATFAHKLFCIEWK